MDLENIMDITLFTDSVRQWAKRQDEVRAVILVGSYARGSAKADSDVDLVILTQNCDLYLQNRFFQVFGPVRKVRIEDWGRITSIRVWYKDTDLEVEFGLGAPDWVSLPLDEGTAKVLSDGYEIILDKDGWFNFTLP